METLWLLETGALKQLGRLSTEPREDAVMRVPILLLAVSVALLGFAPAPSPRPHRQPRQDPTDVVGTWEFVLVRVLKLYGVPGDAALAYALGTHILGTVFVVVLGIAAMVLMRVRPAEIFSFRNKKSEEDVTEPPGIKTEPVTNP